MTCLIAFGLAFVFSFIGSIPPGTLNLSALQMGLEGKVKSAWWFSVAAALVEYPYAWLAVTFEELITSSPLIVQNFERIGAWVMIGLGAINLITLLRPQKIVQVQTKNYGFVKGLVLSILNPLAMPYWIGITAYLKSQGWLSIETGWQLHGYLTGVMLGAFALLITLIYLGKRVATTLSSFRVLKFIPAITLLALGIYALVSSLL
jgi:threonine/homoserine/homoserine lactone efflux protein